MVRRRRKGSMGNETLLLGEVARLYYVKNFTQQHIADRIGVSRTNVSRMLREARERGLVEIKVHTPLNVADELQEELMTRLGLRECLVLASPQLGEDAAGLTDTRDRLSGLGASYLQEAIADRSTVGVSWSSTVYQVVSAQHLQEKDGVTAVQLMGSIGGSITELDGVSITGRLADVVGGKAHYLHAPMLVANAAACEALMQDPHVQKTLEVACSADTMVVSVGVINRNSGQYRTGYLSQEDLAYIRGQGAVGDICGSYFSREGSLVELEMNSRTIAIEFEEMKAIPDRIGVSGGPNKALPNIGAVRAGLLNVLITDENTAREMLDILDTESATQDTDYRKA